MVGLSVVLEAQKVSVSKKTPQVINKTTMLSSINKHSPSAVSSLNVFQHSPFQEPTFLDLCFLCRKRLLPVNDIYMYKAFCSVECRCKQIWMDEEESVQRGNCLLAAMKPASSSASSSEARHHQKGATN